MPAHPALAPAHSPSHPQGSRLVSLDGQVLPFLGGHLAVDAAGGLARIVLRQRFSNPTAQALRVVYQVPLPADAAVSGFNFELGEERIMGEVDRRAAARERFEEALVEGRTAALLEQEREDLFTQEVGNLPPGQEVVCELVLDQRLSWEHGGWAFRFPTVVGPRYLGQEGRVPDAGRVAVEVAEGDPGARMTLALVVRDERTGVLTSPSHALSVDRGRATLAEGGAALDRDLVVRWAVAALAPGARLDLARAAEGPAEASGLLTLVPPQVPGPVVPRDLVVLLDTSGSMHGRPLQQAVAVACALVDSLLPQDQLQLVEFSTRPRAWREQPVAATPAARAEAVAWLRALQAGGGTEMRAGIEAALARLRGEAQRQVVLVTDGLIGFEQEIVRAVREGLPRGSRVHTVGIGSSVNRGLLTPVARAGGGIERVIGLDEDAQRAAAELVAATAAPLVVDLELSGSALVEVVHHRPPDLLAAHPSRLGLRLRAEGGELVVRGQTAAGPWEQRLSVPATAPGQGSGAVVTLVGRERVEEAELRAAVGANVDREVEALGIQYQVATRRTSWLAVSQARTVDPGKPTRRVRVPQAVPYGASVEGLGLRQASGGVVVACLADMSPPRFRKDWAPSGPAGSRSLGQKLANPRDPSPAREPSRVVADHFGAADAEERAREVAERWHEVRVVLARGDRLVLELEVGAAELIWRRPRLLAVTGRDGRELRAHLDLAASTDGGWIRSGQVLRIVLEGPDLGRDWARIEEVLLDADSEHSLRLHLRLVAG